MKVLVSSIVLALFFFITAFSQKKNNHLASKTITCDSVPSLNKSIVAFVKTKIGKKVGRGECWDLASEALNSVNAKWDGKYKFGKEINYKNECVFPGDILQFEGITLKYDVDNKHYMEKLPHHTAVVYEVKDGKEFVMADQNTGRSGKKVGLSPINFDDITKGKFKIFRPTN